MSALIPTTPRTLRYSLTQPGEQSCLTASATAPLRWENPSVITAHLIVMDSPEEVPTSTLPGDSKKGGAVYSGHIFLTAVQKNSQDPFSKPKAQGTYPFQHTTMKTKHSNFFSTPVNCQPDVWLTHRYLQISYDSTLSLKRCAQSQMFVPSFEISRYILK